MAVVENDRAALQRYMPKRPSSRKPVPRTDRCVPALIWLAVLVDCNGDGCLMALEFGFGVFVWVLGGRSIGVDARCSAVLLALLCSVASVGPASQWCVSVWNVHASRVTNHNHDHNGHRRRRGISAEQYHELSGGGAVAMEEGAE
jgi:hypothetical protein